LFLLQGACALGGRGMGMALPAALRLRGGSSYARWFTDTVDDMVVKDPTEKKVQKVMAGKLALKIFEHSEDWDDQGLLYYLGTMGGLQNWTNPHESGWVKAELINIAFSASPSNTLSRTPARLRTKLRKNPWFSLDLGEGTEFLLSNYTIRHGGHKDESPLESWDIQGSNDGLEWETIREHRGEVALKGEKVSHTFEAQAPRTFRYFRIVVHGEKATQLSVGGFELYGRLVAHGGFEGEPPFKNKGRK